MRWTDAQEDAIQAKGNVIVTAAAGSGKTAVLVQRVIEKLSGEAPIDADRLLIVTFTNAAAAEMRQRIEKALADKCAEEPYNTKLLKQQLLISSADICTIDSFCIRLVRNNFSLLGISPDFKIADDSVDIKIKDSICKKLFNEYFEKNDEDFIRFLNCTNSEYGGGNAENQIMLIYDFSAKLPNADRWLKEAVNSYDPQNLWNSIWVKERMDSLLKGAEKHLADVEESLWKLEEDLPLKEKFYDGISSLAELLKRLINSAKAADWDNIYEIFKTLSLNFPAFRYAKAYQKEIFEQVRDTCKSARAFISEASADFTLSSEELKVQTELCHRVIKKISELTLEFDRRYRAELKERSLMTFSLVERLALELLTDKNDLGELVPSELSRSLSDMYDEVMVDEYQDINDLQGMLFEIISAGGKKLFTVGDVKQSIYGFRGSNPENFSKRSDCAEFFTEELSPDTLKRVVLSNNFRSRGEICDFINDFFTVTMSKENGDIEYDSNEMLYPLADFPQNGKAAVEAHFIAPKRDIGSIRAEAVYLADYIVKTVNEEPFLRKDASTLKKASYGDIAILLRQKSNIGIYIKELKSRNIPVALGSGDYFKTTEIMTVISLIKAVDEPMNDIAMLSIMLSPIFGFTEDDVAFLKTKHRGKRLFSAAAIEADNGNEKCLLLKSKLTHWRNIAAVTSTPDFVNDILSDSGYDNIVLSMSDRERRQGNLVLFEQLADGYYSENAGDLSGFLSYLKYLEATEKTTSVSVAKNDAVRILTMHNSKGLQFPVTVIAGCMSEFNKADSRSDLLLNEKLGIAFKYVDDAENKKIDNMAVGLFKKALRKKQTDEEMRLLYVAMTRAEERLVMLFGVGEKFSEKLNDSVSEINVGLSKEGKMSRDLVASGSCVGDWLIPVLLQTPSGKEFLASVGADIPESSEYLKNSFVKVSYAEISPEDIVVNNDISANIATSDDETVKELESIFGYEYPYSELRAVEMKTSVSELTKRNAGREFCATARPAFLSAGGLTPTERGTALHKFMQYADFKSATENVDGEIERLYEYEYISREEANAIDRDRVKKFMSSDLFERILGSDKLFREQRFLLDVKAGQIYPELSENAREQTVIIQGAVDCMFAEKDHIVLIDFKTDRTNDEEFLLRHYSEQLKTYCIAAEKMLSLPVTECYIYSLHMSRKIKVM